MMAFFKTMYEWFHKKPNTEPTLTDEFDHAIKELRAGNEKMSHNIARLEQADVLRSLVISMNSSKNR